MKVKIAIIAPEKIMPFKLYVEYIGNVLIKILAKMTLLLISKEVSLVIKK